MSLENNFGSYFYAGRVYQYYIDNAEDLSKGRIFELGFIVPKTEGIDITGADSTGSVAGASSSNVSSLDVLKELIGDDPEVFAETINALTKELYRPMEEMMLPGQITAFCDFMSESNLEFNLDNFTTIG